jgi:serine/threonine-protein kinase
LVAATEVDRAFLLEGKYRLMAELGRGGMGMVFHALDVALQRDVAVKFLLPELQGDPKLVERFHREALAMASVEHPNVAQIYSYGSYGASPYFVMQYAHGSTVDGLYRGAIERGLHIPLAEVLEIIDQAAVGLSAIHAAGVVHRDIKPGNMIYQADNRRVVIMDFGIGHLVEPGWMTETASIGGTPAYMAPEIIGGHAVPAEEEYLADIYALGITAFELVTACHPGQCESWVEALTWHLSDLPPLPSSIRRGLPFGLDELVLKCLEKDPAARYQSCDEIRHDLAPILSASRHWPQPRKNRIHEVPQVERTSIDEHEPVVVVATGEMEDRAAIRRAVKLYAPGHRVEGVLRFSSALEIAKSRKVVALFASLRDPEMNGLEIAATMVADPRLAKARLVLITDEPDEEERALLQRMGVVEVLGSPLSEAVLANLLTSPRVDWLQAAHPN